MVLYEYIKKTYPDFDFFPILQHPCDITMNIEEDTTIYYNLTLNKPFIKYDNGIKL